MGCLPRASPLVVFRQLRERCLKAFNNKNFQKKIEMKEKASPQYKMQRVGCDEGVRETSETG